MTLPTSDAQSSRILPQRPHVYPHTHSISTQPTLAPLAKTPSSMSGAVLSDGADSEQGIDFSSHSWDLATGGFKTLTAKRELPSLPDRRPSEQLQNAAQVPRSYTFALVILACVVLMLVGGGVALFVVLQP